MSILPALAEGQHKEQYHIAYIQALAASCGWTISFPSVDFDGIDLRIDALFYEGGIKKRSTIEVQLKCTTKLRDKGGVYKYALDVRNYNLLNGTYTLPRYLFVLDISDNPEKWLVENEESISMFKKCYWLSLKGKRKSPNLSTVTVDIPKHQVLNKEVLNEMIRLAENGGSL